MSEPAYLLRYFFEWGSATCLWSGDARTRDAFGYPINARHLPLSDATVAEIERLCTWYQGALNQAYPPDPSPWRQEECDRFNIAARTLLAAIRQELRQGFTVIDERENLREDPDLDAYLRDPLGFRRSEERPSNREGYFHPRRLKDCTLGAKESNNSSLE